MTPDDSTAPLPFDQGGADADTDIPALMAPTRAAGLARIGAFAPRMGGHYKSKRNFDNGPQKRDNVSVLSPYLARRMVTEEETVARALQAHRLSSAEKFVHEVVWRTYFKGWLELRPSVWDSYRLGVEGDRAGLEANRGLKKDVQRAMAGDTGIEAFDVWAEELVETGYLHNHARMWFASIWCFTLDLPWRLGADFFLRHLIDGDAASNTLGWRWVAGLHTVGKNYVAAEWNIAKFTASRPDGALSATGLAKNPVPLDDGGLPPRGALRPVDPPRWDVPTALLLTTEDLAVESLPIRRDPVAVATLRLTEHRSDAEVSAMVVEFDRGALADAATRVGSPDAPSFETGCTPEAIIDWARTAGAERIATPFLHAGWVKDWIDGARPELARAGIAIEEIRRPWDEAFHPHCTAGFFKVKEKIPRILSSLGVSG
ncbi:MAG: FAD-binding domain-containing protein, partial [Pseudomonadota bacterium]